MKKVLIFAGLCFLTTAALAQVLAGLEFRHGISPDGTRIRVSGKSDQPDNVYYARLKDDSTTNTTSRQSPSRRSGRLMWVLGIPEGGSERKYLTVWEDAPTTDVDRQVYSRFIEAPDPVATPDPEQQFFTRDDLLVIQSMVSNGDPDDLNIHPVKMRRVIRRYKMRLLELIQEDESRR